MRPGTLGLRPPSAPEVGEGLARRLQASPTPAHHILPRTLQISLEQSPQGERQPSPSRALKPTRSSCFQIHPAQTPPSFYKHCRSLPTDRPSLTSLPFLQASAQGYSLLWDALPTSSCGSAQTSLCRQEAPVTLPVEVLSWPCMWPWDWHLASTGGSCVALSGPGMTRDCEYPRDRAEWVDPVPARRSWGHIPSAAQVPSQRSLPHPALHSS